MIARLWKSWTESWRSPERARKQYVFVAVAFALLTLIAFSMGEPVVGLAGVVMTVFVATMAYFAPTLVERTQRKRDEESQ